MIQEKLTQQSFIKFHLKMDINCQLTRGKDLLIHWKMAPGLRWLLTV